ncbi:MAG TPA: glycosyltransferase family 4 protein, partial [Polyangiaceae bacterium]
MTDPAAASAAPSRQRIAVVTTSYPTHPDDPSGHFVHAEVDALRAEGHEVAVLAPVPEHGRGRDMPGVRWLAGGTAFGAPGALPRLLARPLRAGPGAARFVWEARRALERLAPDRIVAHFLLPCAWPIAVPRSGVRALEAVAHGSDVRLVSRLPRRLRAAIAKSLAGADVRCVSEELRQELAAALGGALSIRVAPSPLVLPIRASRAEARAALGVPASERLIVIVGRLVRQKRIDAALRAARTIPDAKALVIGDGPERRALELAFPEATFVGHEPRSRALTWIAAADLLLSASRQEGAPSVVREARALGTPVLAVAAGDLEAWSRDDP